MSADATKFFLQKKRRSFSLPPPIKKAGFIPVFLFVIPRVLSDAVGKKASVFLRQSGQGIQKNSSL